MDASTESPPDAASLCGDGVIDDVWEQCDQGALNGTPQGTCTKQCRSPFWTPRPISSVAASLPLSVRAASLSGTSTTTAILAASDLSDSGLQALFVRFDGSVDHVLPLKVHSAAISVAELSAPNVNGSAIAWYGPVWIEQAIAGVGGPWLFYATFDSTGAPTVREIAYPYPDGTRPELVQISGLLPMIVDQSADASHDLLVTELIGRADGSVDTSTTRLPAPGASRGSVVAPFDAMDDKVDFAARPVTAGEVYRFVQFYDDTLAFQTVDVRLAFEGDNTSVHGPYQISEFARGTWPFHVVGGSEWSETCLFDPESPAADLALSHPYPMAVITDTGDIYTWQFDHSPSGGEFMGVPFAHVQPGSKLTMPWGGFGYEMPNALWVLQPDGTELILSDGDNCDPTSPALLPQSAPGTSPWTASLIVDPFAGFTTDATLHNYPP